MLRRASVTQSARHKFESNLKRSGGTPIFLRSDRREPETGSVEQFESGLTELEFIFNDEEDDDSEPLGTILSCYISKTMKIRLAFKLYNKISK
ncbi:hypothetical protein DERP_001651 [Dermatophagoides pteronyssinus]|uniref:Uncharacterized protein n=1 Tax=Dermatophagoides pteronyssinus TaxID=6956 RepID=A0ABQ8JBK7_DERPT|nr:hypothetical protein DERP_001651 [Dermatophagoides pteronyssinus]